MINVIADTNILILLYGAFLNPENSKKSFKSVLQLNKYIQTNKVKVFAPEQVMREFSQCKSKFDTEKQTQFDTFLQNVNPITLTEQQKELSLKLARAFVNEKINYINEYGTLMREQTLFKDLKNKNFDVLILSQVCASKLNMPFVTVNIKDFENYKYSSEILSAFHLKQNTEILTIHQFLNNVKQELNKKENTF